MRQTLSGMLRNAASVLESKGTRKYLEYHACRATSMYAEKEETIKKNESEIAALFTTPEERSRYERVYRGVYWFFPLVGMSYAAWDTINDRRDCATIAAIKMTLGIMGGVVFAHALPLSIYVIPFGMAVAATTWLRKRRFRNYRYDPYAE